MQPFTAKRLVRALQIVAILCFSFSGCTCAGKPPGAPTPTATTGAATATIAPPPAATAPPAGAPAQAAAGTQAPAPAAHRELPPDSPCAEYVAILSGRKRNAAALAKPELRAIAAPDLVMCGAVFSDSDELCKQLMALEHGPSGACLQMRSLFHELRAYPGKPSFMFDEFDWQQCRGVPALTEFCDSLHETLRSGKPEDCEQLGDGASLCRAYMTGDKSLCTVTGKLAQVEFSLPDRKEGEPATVKVKEALEGICVRNIESRAFLGKGLAAVAASGPPRERELAKAALQQPDACDTYVQAAIDQCLGPPPTPAAAQTPAGAGATPAAGGAPAEAREQG